MIAAAVPDALLARLTAGLRSALGPDLLVIYVYGSAVSGGFDEGVSDVDLLVVTGHAIDAQAAARIARFHEATIAQFPAWNDRLELVYVAADTLARFRDGGTLGVISPGEPFHVRDGIELWLQNLYLVRTAGIALVGPPAAALVPDISWREFRAAVRRYAGEVRGRNLRDATPGMRAYCVLTMCRALRTVRTGRPCSKQEGAAWVSERMPEWRTLVASAQRCRLSGGRVGFADDAARKDAEALIACLAAAIEA